MNSMLNINIRVASAAAQAQLKSIEGRLNALDRTAGRSAAGGMSAFNRSLGLANLDRFGKNLQWTGRQLEYNFTLPLVLAGAASTKWALDNERAATSIRKVYGDLGDDAQMLDAELTALSRSFELLSSRYGVVQSEVINIGAAWAQAGAQGVAVAKATRLTLDAMIIGEMDAIEATNGVIAVQSAYRLNTDQLKDALADLNIVENQTAIGFRGLIDVITRAGGTARTAGIDIEHLAAMAASLVPATGSASQAGNALRTMISRLMSPTREAADLMALMGINVKDASWQAMDGVGRIETMAKAFDGLTQSQKAVVSSSVASRWQINRFDILMEDVAKSLDDATVGQSAYGRALEATSVQARSNAVYARELATVLASSPRAFSILTTSIQNAMAKAILPILPAIIGILAHITKLITWFSELDPEIQQIALGFLLLTAAIGPLTRYVGSFILLGTTLGHVFKFLIGGLTSLVPWVLGFGTSVVTTIASIGKLPFMAIGGLMQLMWQGFVIGAKFALASAGVFARGFMALIPILSGAFSALLVTVQTMFTAGIRAGLQVAMASLSVGLTAIRGLIIGAFSGVFQFIAAGFSGVFATIKILFLGGVVPFLKVIGSAILAALTGPWGAVALAVVALAVIFREQIGAAVQWVIRAFNQLPGAVVDVFRTLVKIVQQAALAIYEWLSYINPFVRHSPSLVESVRMGVATILNEYSRLRGIDSIVRNAINAMEDFKRATGGALAGFQMGEFQQQKADIVAVAPGAAAQVDRMIASIFEMYRALDLVNAQISEQTRLVDSMTRRIETGMKPYNDAIWKNEQAQKALRLELLRMEEAGEGIDGIRDKMSKLSGEIEMLRGVQNDLRRAGAGSDVLGFYDQQIKALEDQRDALAATEDPTKALQDALAKLRREGEILELERDLKFDPQLRALEEQENKLRDLRSAYSDINGAINDMEGALREMASAASDALEKAKAAGGGGGGRAAELFAAGAAGDFEVPGGTAPPGLGREGGLADIEAFNKEMEAELQNALDSMGGLDMFAPIKEAWRAAWGWIQDNIMPYVTPIGNAIQTALGAIDLGAIVGGFRDFVEGFASGGDRIGGVIGALQQYFQGWWDLLLAVWDFLQQTFGPVFKWIGDQIVKAGKAIGGELKNWAPLFDDVIEAVTHIANVISWAFKNVIVSVIKVALGVILGVWKAVWPVLKHVLTPIVNAIIGIIRSGLEFVRGIITTVLGVINGDWRRVWEGIATVVDAVWDRIYSVISTPLGLIIGLIRGFVEGVVAFFQWLWDVLVGHSIIPDMINAIIGWFQFLLTMIKPIWDAVWAAIKWAWENIGKPIFTAVKTVIDTVLIPAFRIAQQVIPPIFRGIGDAIKAVWNNVIKPIFDAIKGGMEAVGTVMRNVRDKVISPVWSAISSIISGAWNTIKGIVQGGINFFVDIFNVLANAINAVASALGFGFRVPVAGRVTLGGNYSGARKGTGTYLESGGMVPAGSRGFMTNGITAIVGEGNPMYPEFVIPTDPKYRRNAMALLQQLGVHLFAGGGVPGWGVVKNVAGGAKDVVTGAAGLAGDIVSGAWDSTVGVAKAFWNAIQRVRDAMGGSGFSWVTQTLRKGVDLAVEWGQKTLTGALKSIRDKAWDVGAVLNPVDDVMNVLGLRAGGMIPQLARGGIVLPRPGGTLVNVAERGKPEAIVPLPSDWNRDVSHTYNFYGDLEFPNITSPDDADKFLRNLTDLAGAK